MNERTTRIRLRAPRLLFPGLLLGFVVGSACVGIDDRTGLMPIEGSTGGAGSANETETGGRRSLGGAGGVCEAGIGAVPETPGPAGAAGMLGTAGQGSAGEGGAGGSGGSGAAGEAGTAGAIGIGGNGGAPSAGYGGDGGDGGEAGAKIIPGCGNTVIEKPEGCDDGNLVSGDGCSATCTDEDCDACRKTSCILPSASGGLPTPYAGIFECYGFTDPKDTELCSKLLSCIRKSGCDKGTTPAGKHDPGVCFCGSIEPSECYGKFSTPSTPQGPCRAEILAAGKLVEPTQEILRATILDAIRGASLSPLGVALSVPSCERQTACKAACSSPGPAPVAGSGGGGTGGGGTGGGGSGGGGSGGGGTGGGGNGGNSGGAPPICACQREHCPNEVALVEQYCINGMCNEVLACTAANDCMTANPYGCYCGTRPPAECMSRDALIIDVNGKCRDQIAGLVQAVYPNADTPFMIKEILDGLTSAPGATQALLVCTQEHCAGACNPTP